MAKKQEKDTSHNNWIAGIGAMAALLTALGANQFFPELAKRWFPASNPVPPNTLLGKPNAPQPVTANPNQQQLCAHANSQQSIIQAAGRGNLERVRECIGFSTDPNIPDGNGWTALHAAAFRGHLPVVKFLLANGAQLEAKESNKRTALYLAVMENQYAVADYLLQNGADKSVIDKLGSSLASRTSPEMRKLLVKY